ncbi:signal transduction histidine kinase [Mumia flava]|uniref:histidine kinase n=1 Tax=Mumia flava TaxID=1348852 RepID=A0A0B2BLS1_9ACTN|nr:histidine kinase [Mumia flava]PJJ56293.1 signal transduction histidine kinase [Mumia flava]
MDSPVTPAAYQPPLRWWNSGWRYALAAMTSGVAWLSLAPWQWRNSPLWAVADLVAGLACFALLPLRRRYPVTVALICSFAVAFSALAAGPHLLAMASLATRRRWPEIVSVSAVAVVSVIVFTLVDPSLTEDRGFVSVLSVLVVVVVVAIGLYVGSRRELLYTLRERARTAEEQQAERVAQARVAERTRLAREMHDVLAHRISLVAMHAGALAYREDLPPEQVREASGVIRDNAHLALTELREVLGILRDDTPSEAPEPPQPSWDDLPDLIDGARSAGMRVLFDDEITAQRPPERAGRTAYRVVQEALTNAHKHAPGTTVRIALNGSPDDGVVVEARNPLRVGTPRPPALPESGLGLAGMSERAQLAGGRLSYRIVEHEFVLVLALPWPT